MVELKKRTSKEGKTSKDIQEIEEYIDISLDSNIKTVSTGSTLLDLIISGKRIKGGGIPQGILVEVYGPSGSGKTAILAEIAASAQIRGGDALILDPEARFDKEYARIYGVQVEEENYERPDTVEETFEFIRNWKPKSEEGPNVVVCDSLAALSTEMELEEGDKMGMRRAKEFSQELRKICRFIANKGWIIVCSNQIRQGTVGETTPGGNAIPFYSSLRIRVAKEGILEKSTTLKSGKSIKKVIGIKSNLVIKKSSVDEPFRQAYMYIVFGYGIDDVRANLQYIKDMNKLTKYKAIDKEYKAINDAIAYIEKNNLHNELRNQVIELWEEIQDKLKLDRKPKPRW